MTILRVTALFLALLLLGLFGRARANPAAEQPPRMPGVEHTTLYDGRYVLGFRFYPMGNRTWYVGFESQETSNHMDPRKRSHAVISKDDGRTWQATDLVVDNPSYRSSPSRLVKISGYSWRYDVPARRSYYEAKGLEVRDTPDGRIAYADGYFVSISNDNGATWVDRDIDFPRQALMASYRDDRSFLRLDAKTILRAVYGKPVARLRYYEAWCLRSEDDGETWSLSTIGANLEEDVGHGETAIAQAGNGDIVAMMRTEPIAGARMWVSRSTDRGKSWSPAKETPLLGHPAHLLRLKDGRMLCSYGLREAPIGIRVCISPDDGRTWPEENIRVLRTGPDLKRDSGYPITLQAEDGTMMTVYYLTEGDKTTLQLTRWQLPKK